MYLTASAGWVPTVVSPDSITASVPSKTALATSDISARVGLALVYIEASISVATMHVLPTVRHFSIICF